MRIIILYLLCFVVLFSCACQATPEQVVVVPKAPIETVEEINIPVEPQQDVITNASEVNLSFTDRNVTIQCNAVIDMPLDNLIPVYPVKRLELDMATVQELIDELYVDIEEIHNEHLRSKSQIEMEIIERKRFLAEVQEGLYDGDGADNVSLYVAEATADIQSLEAEYAVAPDNPVETGQYKLEYVPVEYGEQLSLVGWNSRHIPVRFYVFKTLDKDVDVGGDHLTFYVDDLQGAGYSAAEQEGEDETALDLINAQLKSLNMGDYWLSSSERFVRNDGNGYEIRFQFNRVLHGIPISKIEGTYGGVHSEKDIFVPPFRIEELEIYVEDGEITYLSWRNPLDIDLSDEEYVELLPFPKIMELFQQQIARSLYGDRQVLLQINEIRFSYFPVVLPNDMGRYQLVPVWDFIGTRTSENKDIARIKASYLTLNAIDGSAIDRSLGY